jgi:glutathione S-transferase
MARLLRAHAVGRRITAVERLDAHLREHEWLVPGQYTLADICNFAIANGMQFGFAELVNKEATPGLVRWIEQINARPAARAMFAEVELEKLGPRD